MMFDVVFITPNFTGFVRDEPVGTLLLATILQRSGIQPKILPYYSFGNIEAFDSFVDSAVEMVLACQPKIVSFYTRCDTYHVSIRLAQCIKKRNKDIFIIFGGPQCDLSAEETLRAIHDVDYICCGEGETTIVPFFTSLIADKPDLCIKGLVYRNGEEICCNPRPELIPDLDALPMIDYSLLKFKNEERTMFVHQLFPVDVGRGCPFSCAFCSTKTFWGRKYRLKSPDRIIAEIKEAHKQFGVTSFNFEHDMFTLNREKVIQICKMLKKIGFPIKWRCSARVDCLDEELIDIMVDAGMNTLFLGIETGSPRMQKLIRKNLKINDVYEKLSYISNKGVKITASFIFGFPEETEEDFNQTVSLMTKLSKLPKIVLQHHLCAFLAGTELTEKYRHLLERASIFSDATNEFAVRECNDIISAHPMLFPHYFESKSDLRDKVKYYPQFFDCWVTAQPVYEYIASRYYGERFCDMVSDFSDKNRDLLITDSTCSELLREDKFLDSFSEDEQFALLKEILRFLLWKIDPAKKSSDIFGFDVKALLNGEDIAKIKAFPTVVSYVEDKSGSHKIVIMGKS